MPTGAWRRRPPLPPTPGLTAVCPIGEATPQEAEEYRRGRLEALATAVDGYFAAGRSTAALRELYAAWEALRRQPAVDHAPMPCDHYPECRQACTWPGCADR